MEIKLIKPHFLFGKRVLMMIMRIFIFLLCTTVFSLTTENGLAQKKVTLDHDKTLTVDEVFEIIANQTEYNFIYPENLFKNIPKVKLQKGIISVGRLLQITLPKGKYNAILGTDNRITIKEKNQSQKIEVFGVVKDKDGLLLPGVTVSIKGTNKGLPTDFEGTYQITVPDAASVLVFSYIGFQTQEIIVGEQTEINIILQEEVSSLEEVVLVGYGRTKKKDLTGSVGTVKAVEISQIKTQTIDQALVGKIPGVYINAVSGAPGAGAIVHIRGLSALRGDNQPLYVVDGVPIIVNPIFEENGIGLFGNRENPLLAINPNDIERVDVLKDASAAGIYGSRAANGVVLITTKRGTRNQKPQFTFSLNSTISNPVKKWDVLNVDQYKTFVTEGAQARIAEGSGSTTDNIIVNTPNQFFGNANTDWQDEITNNNALWNDYKFGLNGGTENINYLVSAGVTDQEGIMIGSQLDRYSLSANIDADVTERIKTGVSFNYNYSVNKTSGVTDLTSGFFRPDLGVYDDNGQYTGTPALGGVFGPDVISRNPVGGSGLATNKIIGQYLFGSVYGEVKIIDGLKFRSQINISVSNDKASNFDPSFSDNAIFNLYSSPVAEATLEQQRTDAFATVFSNTLNYSKSFGEHKIDAIIGMSWDHNRTDIEAQTYSGFPDDFILVDPRSANRISSYESESIEGGLNSLFGRVNYNFEDRYLATLTIRRDGSTKFGTNNQYGTFPSGALAWNMHNEDFFNIDAINQLKLRASLGRTGNDNLASFSYLAYMSSLANNYSLYANVNGIAITGLPNPNIRWESTDQLDLGIEFGAFNNRLNGEIVYFEKNTTGIILYTPLPSETGFAAYNANVADVSNKGWEITIGGDIIRNTNFNWNSSFNISFIKGVVDNLYDGSIASSGSSPNILEGQPIGVISGYVQEGIAQDQAQITALNAGASDGSYYSGLTQPGDYIYKDINGDGEITTLDRTVLGDINPDYFGGWNNSFSYKNFDASINVQFAQGHSRQVSNSLLPQLSNSDPYLNTTTIVYDTWTPENTNATYGRLGAPAETLSSTFISDASYVRLRSASVGYNFENQWLTEMGIERARLNFSGNNLLTITDYAGLDPESVSNPRGGETTNLIQDEGFAYPLAQTFTLGLTISF
ncbi:TonB-dependent receptor [Lutibacter sp. A80]|uniref:SusC/RagA family TonB-linked outer membrane protein n=1 Tax=Lutibacter sp. A80 TaxID=2918453 RepID=UPI001F068B1F|nr:TonB-dependent receptor [Lutibacter sp. A80]UMB61587.1 TonB-dependent receptor [Lutibacter sp. A80]